LLLSACISGSAFAKCAIQTVVVSGTVLDRKGVGVADAAVAVSWLRRGKPQGPALAFSDSDGAFRLVFNFDTFSSNSLLRGDVCDERLSQVSVSALKPGYRAEPLLVSLEKWSARVDLHVDPFRE
jgi:hypothetical protein